MASLVLSQAATSALAPSLYGAMASGASVAASGALWSAAQAITGALGTIAGSALDRMLFNEKQDYQGPRLGDLSVQTSTEGASLPLVYGTMRIAGNVIWSTGLTEASKKKDVGGGSGGGGNSYTTYSYSTDCAVALCEGTITGVSRIWADTKLIYDASYTAKLEALRASNKSKIRVYTGSETQLCDPLIQAVEGTDLAYRGTAYVVFEDLQLADYGNRLPNFSFEVVKNGSLSGYNINSTSELISSRIFNTGYDIYGNLYGYSVVTNIASYVAPTYGNASYYKINTQGIKTLMFSADLSVITDGYMNILTSQGTSYTTSLILYKAPEVHIIIREFYGIKSSTGTYNVGCLVHIGNTEGTNFPYYPSYAISGPGAPGGWGATIAFKSTTEGICSCGIEGPLVYFNGSVSTTIWPSYSYGLGVTAIAFFSNKFLVVRGSWGPNTFYWYDYNFNLIESAVSTVVGGKNYFTFNDKDNCIYRINSFNSLLKVGPVDSLTTFNNYEIISIGGSISLPGSLVMSDNSTTSVYSETPNIIKFSQNFHTPNVFRELIATTNTVSSSSPTLKSVAEDITARSGLPISKYSYSNLTDVVRGYHIAKKMPIKDALEPLTAAYRFDIIEEDSKIVGRPYLPSSTSVRTLTIQEVGTQNYD
jgi:hypothetical protein